MNLGTNPNRSSVTHTASLLSCNVMGAIRERSVACHIKSKKYKIPILFGLVLHASKTAV
jgi:hypothetical protein